MSRVISTTARYPKTWNHHQIEISRFTKDLAEEMCQYLVLRDQIPDFHISSVVVSFDKRRLTSYGGDSGNGKISVNFWLRRTLWLKAHPNSSVIHKEYDHIKMDQDIGDLRCRDWRTHAGVLVAHEIAHCAEAWMYANMDKSSHVLQGYQWHVADEHGPFWQSLYRTLRVRFVNYMFGLDRMPINDVKKESDDDTHRQAIQVH